MNAEEHAEFYYNNHIHTHIRFILRQSISLRADIPPNFSTMAIDLNIHACFFVQTAEKKLC